MKFYQKSSPILMIVGFLSLVAGVALSIQIQLVRAAYVLVAIGLILYIIGRIGVYFTPKENIEKDDDTDEENEKDEVKTIDETGRNKIEI